MNLLGYVSDEMYVAIPDVFVELEALIDKTVTVLRSSPRGALRADLPVGMYRATLAKAGYGSKTSTVEIGGGPVQFRLLSDGLLGYMWPKWVRSGETAEFRIHATEQYQLTLWRYGREKEYVAMVGWMDEHGPQANRQILPDGDFTQFGV